MDKSDEVLRAIDALTKLLAARMAAIDQRFDRLEGDTADLKAESVATRAEIGALKVDVAEIKDRLRRLDEKLEISELRGRVEEISRRLPTTLAYSPPPTRTGPAD